MRQGKRFGLSTVQKSELWRRWKAGQSLHEIGRAFGKEHSSIRCLVARHGGIVPAVRRRSRRVLTAVEREDISRGLASGASLRKIAQLLDRAASTVSREVARHGGRPEYRGNEADQRAWDSALRPKRCLLGIREQLLEIVASKLLLDWSPEQISGWLTTQYPRDERMRVSHETIYRSLFIQARGVLKKELVAHLRSKRRIRRSQHSRIFKDARGQIADAISIRERPAEVADRAIPGHWEGDLLGEAPEFAEAHVPGPPPAFASAVSHSCKLFATLVGSPASKPFGPSRLGFLILRHVSMLLIYQDRAWSQNSLCFM
jgi:IS30 family transposase